MLLTYLESLSTELGTPSHLIIAAMHDRASVNAVAMHTVSVLYNRIFDVGCMSHTLAHVGERLSVQVSSRPGLVYLHTAQKLGLYG